MRAARSIGLLAALSIWASTGMGAELAPAVPTFVKRYCIECHDAETEKGDRNFEPFLSSPGKVTHHEILREMLDQLNLGEMPPRKKNVARPPDSDRRAVVAALDSYLGAAAEAQAPPSTVMRRLTRHEYNYTMRDLLGIDTTAADATRLFPDDLHLRGFANHGPAQALSGHQLRLYMQAARAYLDRALVFGQNRPDVQRWTFKPEDFNHESKNVGTVRYRVIARDGAHLDIGHGQPVDSGPTYPKKFANRGVPQDGRYRIRVKATAVGRKNPYDPKLFRIDLSQPLQMGLWHVPDMSFLKKRSSEGRVFIRAFDLADNEPKTHEATVWMPAGSSPFVHWINGLGSSKRPLRLIIERYHPEAKRKSRTEVDRLEEAGLPVPRDALVQKVWISDLYQGPRVRIFEMTIEGPLHEQWPPAGHRKIVGTETDAAKVDLEETLLTFAAKAFRRPVKREEIAHHIRFVHDRVAASVDSAEALKQGLTAVLSSPRFLFLDEGDVQRGARLDDFQLATRLSYALWCSTPDERLQRLAAEGRLRHGPTLRAETERLLEDPRAQAFVRHFTDAWLRLDRIGSMPPGNKQFPAYYRDRLESAMQTETRLFVGHVLRHNRPIPELLTARHSFLNGALARHYGVPGVVGEDFRLVNLPGSARRGGLLGHASVLTATANGVETSPVTRGVWVLESLLGTPPSPPPPDVPAIEPDTRGATTIRDQLARHRHVTACADCHSKIDPWGFALEYFDPIGGLRTYYPRTNRRGKGRPIDGSGQLPSGEQVRDEADLRRLLAARKALLTRNLTNKLLLHATGREPNFRDRVAVNRIVERSLAGGNGFGDLLFSVIASDLFTRR